MQIDSYSFGRIVINGTTYTSDVIIYPDRVDGSWWRKQGHLLRIEDLEQALRTKPDILIIGTGYSGVMRVSQETVDLITGRGIVVKVARTAQAVDLYNGQRSGGMVIAALHLTC